MNKKTIMKIVLKTTLFCLSLFMLIMAGLYFGLKNYYEPIAKEKVKVVIAMRDLEAGDLITEDAISFKSLKEDDLVPSQITNIGDIVGKKVLTVIKKGDYVSAYRVTDPKSFTDNERIVTIQMNNEFRVSNLAKKGSLIDLKVRAKGSLPKTVLKKVKVEDIVDDSGNSVKNAASEGVPGISNNNKLFVKLILDNNQRNRVYAAQDFGTLFMELYLNEIQKAPEENFVIPDNYFSEPIKVINQIQ